MYLGLRCVRALSALSLWFPFPPQNVVGRIRMSSSAVLRAVHVMKQEITGLIFMSHKTYCRPVLESPVRPTVPGSLIHSPDKM